MWKLKMFQTSLSGSNGGFFIKLTPTITFWPFNQFQRIKYRVIELNKRKIAQTSKLLQTSFKRNIRWIFEKGQLRKWLCNCSTDFQQQLTGQCSSASGKSGNIKMSHSFSKGNNWGIFMKNTRNNNFLTVLPIFTASILIDSARKLDENVKI
jgi:hypothetical protein